MRRSCTLLLALVAAIFYAGSLSSRVLAQSAPAPAAVTASSSSSTSVAVEWSQVAGATGYTVSYGTTSTATGATKSVSGGSTLSTTVSSLTSGTTYYFIVAATGGTYSSPSVSAVPNASALASPSPVACKPSSGQVVVSWGGVSGATGYTVYRGTSTSTAVFASVSSSTQSYTDSSVSNGTTYYYRVSAYNASGSGTQSDPYSATPPGTGVVGPPQDLLYENGSGDIDVDWEAVSGATSYNIYRSTVSSADCASQSIPVASRTSQDYVDTSVTSGSTYWYCVTAVDAAGEGPKSSVIQAVAGAARGAAPTNVAATAGTSVIHLTWTAPSGGSSPSGYSIYRSQDGSTYDLYVEVSGASTISYDDTSVTNGTIEYYRVDAVYNGVESSYSSISATPVASTTLSATVSSTPAVNLSWTQAAGATGYSVYRSASTPVSTTGTPYATTGSASSVTYSDSGISAGQAFSYVVVATNSSGSSTPSNTVTEQVASSAPTGLVATPGDAQVVLTWTAPSGNQGVTGYNVYRGTSSGGESTTPINGSSPVAATTYTDMGLTDGTTYYYQVTALSPGGQSGPSNEASATPVHAPPTVVTAAAANPNPVTGTTTALTVLGGDNAGESTLIYTWSASGPASVTYSGATNGTNAAKNITATFTAAGTYTFTVQIADAYGGTVSSSVSVVVNQTATILSVTPASATVAAGGTQQFTANAKDQFGTALTTQPTFTWSASRGSVTGAGLYTAPSTSGSDTVTATSGSVHGLAAITVNTPAGPSGVAITINTATPIAGNTASLTGSATGTSVLTYTWSASPSSVTFSPNGTSESTNTTVTFTAAGTYSITLTVTDSYGQTATATTTIVVDQTYSAISINPASVYVTTYATQQFTASANDQFGAALSTQPTFTWDADNGSITSAGLYTAPGSAGSDTATASSGGRQGSAAITVTAGNAPTITLTAQETSSSSITLSWQQVSGASTYNIYRSTTSGGEGATPYKTGVTIDAPGYVTATYLDNNLPENTRYYYQVAGVSSSGVQGSLSNEASATTGVTPLPAPSFTHVIAGNAQVALSWTAVAGATGYFLTRATTYQYGPPTLTIMSIAGNGYTDTGLTNGTNYIYTVAAVDADGLGISSASVSAVPGSTPPAAPTGLTAQETSSSSITLSWQQVSGASTYNIYRSTTSGGEGATPYKTGVTIDAPGYVTATYLDNNLPANTRYYYQVSAVSSGSAESSLSNEASATTGVTPLPAPSFTHVVAGNAQVALSWTAVAGATGYILYHGTESNYFYTIYPISVSGTSYTDINLTNGTTYFYRVAALDADGLGIASSSVSAVPGSSPPPAPTGLTAQEASSTSIVLDWPQVSGASTYNVYRSTMPGGEGATPYVTGVYTTNGYYPLVYTYTDTGLTSGTTYYYKVSAVASTSAESGLSNEASATPGVAPLPAPTLTSIAVANSQLTPNWTTVSGATSYVLTRLLLNPYGPPTNRTILLGITGTSYTDTGLANGSTYTYTVAAENVNGLGASSNSLSAVPSGAPAGVTITVNTATPITGTMASLTGSATGSAPLTYTWSAAPSTVSFSPNGTSAAASTTATFTAAGTYTITLTVSNSYGQASTSTTVVVSQTETTILVTPANSTVVAGYTQQFSAIGEDQFGAPLATQPPFGWRALYGTITNPGGLYTAPSPCTDYVYAYDNYTGSTQGSTTVNVVAQQLGSDTLTSLHVNCGGPTYPDRSDGVTWITDLPASGNDIPGCMPISTSASITNVKDPTIYQTQQTGQSIPENLLVANGTYTLSLYFAEIQGLPAGRRVMSVTANNQTLLGSFDAAAVAGGDNIAVVERFQVQVTNNTLNLVFASLGINYGYAPAAVAAIGLDPANGGPVPTPVAPLPGNVATNVDIPVPGWAGDVVPTDSSDADGDGPSSSVAVSLPTGVEENHPGPDIWSYNPVGPSASFQRTYRASLAAAGYMSPGLSEGWTDNYDLRVNASAVNQWAPLVLTYPNGAQEDWTPALNSNGQPITTLNSSNQAVSTLNVTSTGGVSQGAPYLVTGIPVIPSPGSTESIGLWQSLTVTYQDHSSYTFQPSQYNSNAYQLCSITNLVGHSITFDYNSDGTLSGIYNDANAGQNPPGAELLSFTYNGGQLNTVSNTTTNPATNTSDTRTVTYGFDFVAATVYGAAASLPALSTVSIVNEPYTDRWQYQYETINGVLLLSYVGVPNPDIQIGGTSWAQTQYDPNTGAVASHTDANNRVRQYSYDPSIFQTTVTVKNSASSPALLNWTQNYSTSNLDTGIVEQGGSDIAYPSGISAIGTSVAYGQSANPYSATQVSDPNGKVASFSYDPFGTLTGTETGASTPRQVTTSCAVDYSQNTLGEITSQTWEAGQPGQTGSLQPSEVPLSLVYYPNGLVKTVTTEVPNDLGHPINNSPDDTGHTVTTTYTYDSYGNITGILSPGPNSQTTTAYSYAASEALGEPTTVTVSGNDWQNNLTSESVSYQYDQHGNVTAYIDGNGFETDYSYNDADQVTEIQYPPADSVHSRPYTVVTYEYVGGPVEYATDTGDGGYNTSSPSSNGNTQVTSYSYDPEGELYSVVVTGDTSGKNHSDTYSYDAAGHVTSVTDSMYRETQYFYDSVGNLSEVEYPNTDVTQYTSYDPAGHLLTSIDANNVTTTYAYSDPDNLLTNVSYSNPGYPLVTEAYQYDALGRRQQVSDSSCIRTYQYDDLDDLSSEDYDYSPSLGPQLGVSYQYNQDGSLAVSYGGGADGLTYAYDGLGRVVGTNPSSPYADFYSGNYAGEEFNYGYDAGGRLTSQSNPAVQTTYGYNGRGELTGMTNSCGFYYGINTFTQPDPSTSIDAGAPFAQYSQMSYDGLGHRLGMTAAEVEFARTLNYSYDNLGELTGETSTTLGQLNNSNPAPLPSYSNTFLQDNVGNFFGGDPVGDYVNADNELTGFIFDGDGNQTDSTLLPLLYTAPTSSDPGLISSATAASLTWDVTDRLVRAASAPNSGSGSGSSSGSVAFDSASGYLSDGRRAWSDASASYTPGSPTGGPTSPVGAGSASTHTYYLYDDSGAFGSVPMGEYNASGVETATNIVGPDGWRERTVPDWGPNGSDYYGPSATDDYFAFDPQGSAAERIRLDKTRISNFNTAYLYDESAYDAYGDRLLDQGPDTSGGGGATSPAPIIATDTAGYEAQFGYQTDPTSGLLLAGHRYYQPQTRRWLNRDPIGYAGGDNLYEYSNDDPVNEADPSGDDPAGSYTTFGGYLDEVGQVLEGEASVLNPVAAYKSGAALYSLARARGIKYAGAAALQGAEHSYSALWNTNDDREFGQSVGTWGVTAFGVGAGGLGISKALAGGITNAVPGTLARVVAGKYGEVPTLGPPGASDVFVTGASDLKGITSASGIAKRLTIDPEASYRVYEFPAKSARGLASPILRKNLGFVGRGRTAGGAREFVIENMPVPEGAKVRIVGP